MRGLKNFIKTTILGGLLAILPLALLLALLSWLYGFLSSLLTPLRVLLEGNLSWPSIVLNLFIIGIILGLCFLLGLAIRTSVGRKVIAVTNRYLLERLPGYKTLSRIITQFATREKSPFQSVALARPFDNDTYVSAFITEFHSDGRYTVFVPTAPNPTSGNIYHLDPSRVHLVDQSVEEAIRTIISCGVGSDKVLKDVPPKLGESSSSK